MSAEKTQDSVPKFCCTPVPVIYLMAARAYESLQWDMPVCQSTANYRNKNPGSVSKRGNSSKKQQNQIKAPGNSRFYAYDSDAYFQGDDDEKMPKKKSKHRRKVNSPLSVKEPPNLRDRNSNKIRHSSDVGLFRSGNSVSKPFPKPQRARSRTEESDRDSDVDFNDTLTEVEADELRERFRKLTRSLSIADRRRPVVVPLSGEKFRVVANRGELGDDCGNECTTEVDSSNQSDRLFDCIFIAGICHDMKRNQLVPFTRNQFPEEFELPPGIAELCFPDFADWSPHTPDRTRTYNIVLTDFKGQRTFGYCRRIQPEGDDLCLPLAMCILTRHARARGLFSQILVELTRLYGHSEYDMLSIYRQLRSKPFPSLGGSIDLKIKVKVSDSFSSCQKLSSLHSDLNRRSSISHMFSSVSSNLLFRRNSSQESTEIEFGQKLSYCSLRFKRPIDFRMDGAPMCTLLSTDDILNLCSAVLREKRVVVISHSLSDLSTLFDGIESLLFPLSWQHTLIPALPPTRRIFLEAPTPYLIGVLVDADTSPPNVDGSVDDTNDPFWKSLKGESMLWQDPECFIMWISPTQNSHLVRNRSARKSLPQREQFAGSTMTIKMLHPKDVMPFPDSVIQTLKNRLEVFDKSLASKQKSTEGGEDLSIARFVIFCETFLQMYNCIFANLVSYLNDDKGWTPTTNENEEERKFKISDYLRHCVPVEYHEFATEVSGVSLFEEYIRGRISALDIEIESGSLTSGILLTRKCLDRSDQSHYDSPEFSRISLDFLNFHIINHQSTSAINK